MEKKSFSQLPIHVLTHQTQLLQTEVQNEALSLHAPAMEILTDFRKIRPIYTQTVTSLSDAEHAMITHAIRLLFVMNHEQELVGLVTASDLLGTKPFTLDTPRHQITVADVMTPKEQLLGLTLDELENASIGEVLVTMKKLAVQHLVIIDDYLAQKIVGLISTSTMARKLHLGKSFQEILMEVSELRRTIPKHD